MNEVVEKQSSALGIASLVLAAAGVVLFILFAINAGISIRSGTVYVVTLASYGFRPNLTFAGIAVSCCLLGFVFGVEGYRNPASQKLFAIVGALMNATILFAAAAAFGMRMVLFL